ncbi:MAG: hypothetical protein H0U71_01555 [Gammaproteobacteria bacterium]|nr:hypothetical protein [Gammaproteobacteria bacterium]
MLLLPMCPVTFITDVTGSDPQATPVIIKNNEDQLLKLANEDNMPLAQNLIFHYYSHRPPDPEKQQLSKDYLKLAVKKCNGLATLNYLALLNKDVSSGSYQQLMDVFEKSVSAFTELMQTSYRESAIKFLKNLTIKLSSLDKIGNNDDPAFFKENKSSQLAQLWIKLSNFYKNYGTSSYMYMGLQKATKLDNSYRNLWLQSLNVDKAAFRDVARYLDFYIKVLEITQNKLTSTPSNDELENTLLFLKVEKNNCVLLADEFSKTPVSKDINVINDKLEIIQILFAATENSIKETLETRNPDLVAGENSFIQSSYKSL